jgi:hypothetical protein
MIEEYDEFIIYRSPEQEEADYEAFKKQRLALIEELQTLTGERIAAEQRRDRCKPDTPTYLQRTEELDTIEKKAQGCHSRIRHLELHWQVEAARWQREQYPWMYSERKKMKDNPRENIQIEHERSVALLAEMQQKFKPDHAGKVVETLVAAVNRQIAETDVWARDVTTRKTNP